MKTKLLELLENSYSPYSKFRVSSIVVTKDDKCYSGVNIENASYGATICAERVAILKAVSNGHRKGDLKKIYVDSVINNPEHLKNLIGKIRNIATKFGVDQNNFAFDSKNLELLNELTRYIEVT